MALLSRLIRIRQAICGGNLALLEVGLGIRELDKLLEHVSSLNLIESRSCGGLGSILSGSFGHRSRLERMRRVGILQAHERREEALVVLKACLLLEVVLIEVVLL